MPYSQVKHDSRRCYWWRNFKPRRALEGLTSPMIGYLGRGLVNGREQCSSTIKGHLYRESCVDHCVMVMTVFLTCAINSRALSIRNLSRHDARMWIRALGIILFPLFQHVFGFVCGINVQDFVERT